MNYLPKLFDSGESPVYLIAHGCHYVKNWYHLLFVDKRLSPNLSIHLFAHLQVSADLVFVFGDLRKLFASVDVEASLCLSQVSSTLYFIKLLSHNTN